jgi:hypothetical protein
MDGMIRMLELGLRKIARDNGAEITSGQYDSTNHIYYIVHKNGRMAKFDVSDKYLAELQDGSGISSIEIKLIEAIKMLDRIPTDRLQAAIDMAVQELCWRRYEGS